MSNDHRIVIAYALSDNDEIIENGKGWVSNFQRFMEMMLGQLSGESISIEIYNEKEINSELLSAKVLIVVMSTEMASNTLWIKYFENHIATREQHRTLFKLVKSPVPAEKQPLILQDLLEYDLFHTDPDTDVTKEINTFFGPEAEKDYWMRLVDLAYDIYSALMADKKQQREVLDNESYIYLAETGTDLAMYRNLIKRELIRYGYKVLPDHSLVVKGQELEERIRKDLGHCNMSIHMVGNSFGDVLNGTNVSILDMQNRLAAEHSVQLNGGSKFNRLIWLAPELTIRNEKQRTFINTLKRSAENLNGAEILQTPLEDFKNIIRKKLSNKSADTVYQSTIRKGDDPSKQIAYLIYDQEDAQEVGVVEKQLAETGYIVLKPLFEGELLDIRNHHLDNLRHFDIGIVYKANVNDTWVRMKLYDLLKAPGFGRTKPVIGKALIHKGSIDIEDVFFSNYQVERIDQKQVDEQLPAFLQKNKA